MSRRSKSATRYQVKRPKSSVRPRPKPQGILRRIRNTLPSASTAVKALVALGIPAAAAYALHNKYPNAVEKALNKLPKVKMPETFKKLKIPKFSMPEFSMPEFSVPDFPYKITRKYDGSNNFTPEQLNEMRQMYGEGIGGVRRRRVRKPALLSELSSTLRNRSRSASRYASRAVSRVRSRSKSGRGEGIGGVRRSKRPLTAYQKFVKKHRKPGVSLSQVAKMWRNR